MVFTASSPVVVLLAAKPVMPPESLSRERLAGVERVELDLVSRTDEALSDGGKIGDLELALFAAGQIDQVLGAVVAEVVQHRRRAEADEVARADLVLRVSNPRHSPSGEDVHEFF